MSTVRGTMTHQEILSLVTRPGRYLGTEINAAAKPWDRTEIRVCCIFPDLYEIGMSHQGLALLYAILNAQEWALADRCYCPDRDMEQILKREGKGITSLEQRRNLWEFDILAITLPYELCYSNILTILDLAGIPFSSAERQKTGGTFPLILGGGSAAVNPEPIAQLFDAIVIGDGEEAIIQVAQAVRREKQAERGIAWPEFAERLEDIPGIYCPGSFQPLYDAKGDFCGMKRLYDGPEKIRRRILPDLSAIPMLTRPLVPTIQVVHDRLGIEIARGCTRGCRFCQASSTYRPVRERPLSQVLEAAEEGLKNSGWEELSLLSLSTGDYSALEPLICTLMDRYLERNISISLPSLRVGTLTPAIMEQIRRVRKTGFTLAPEAGTQRLRDLLNKGIDQDDLIATVVQAVQQGWRSIKFYFMIGLPTETDQDIQGIIDLCHTCLSEARAAGAARSVSITASIGTFVPKPHTPFQWEPQISEEESRHKIAMLKRGLSSKKFTVKWHDPQQSLLEGIFSRGDRRLFQVLCRAWEQGARLDAWSDQMRAELYLQAARDLDMDPLSLLAPRQIDKPLPWDHIDLGISKAYLRRELKRAREGKTTPDCRFGSCQKCGACDLKEIKPVLFPEKLLKTDQDIQEEKPLISSASDGPKTCLRKDQSRRSAPSCPAWYRLLYEKTGPARFLGHLDLTRTIHKALRRAELPMAFSKGFHPMPKTAFGQPLSLGIESLQEEMVLQLESPEPANQVMDRLNRELPQGIKITACLQSASKLKITTANTVTFICALRGIGVKETMETVKQFSESEEFWWERTNKKGKKRRLDLKKVVEIRQMKNDDRLSPEIKSWMDRIGKELSTDFSTIVLTIHIDRGHIAPYPALQTIFALTEQEARLCRIIKLPLS